VQATPGETQRSGARTVAVTGAGSGIGRAIAAAFAAEGDRVHVCDISAPRLEATLGRLPGASGAVVDVADAAALRAFLEDAADGTGLDVLVNCAGIFDGYAGIEETSKDLWDRIIDINLTGAFNGCKIAAELMRRNGAGRIINIGSIASFSGGADGLAYTASKAGLLGLTRRLAFDVGPHGITANVICPGTIATDIRANSAEILGDAAVDMDRGVGVALGADTRDFLVRVGRAGTVDEVAATAVFLASDGAAYINGETIAVDGGWLSV
jgi:NAD(P)-dependent dehydrogenase (short-subunit alcohol dehydrogenase family)